MVLLGRSDHGAPVSHGTCSLQAVLCQQTPSPQDTSGLGYAGRSANPPLAANRSIVLVADSAFAAIEFFAAVRNHVCVVTRLRLDANLFAFPPPKRKGRGRPSLKGKPLKKLAAVLRDRRVSWQRYRVSIWYGRTNRLVEVANGALVSRRCDPGADPLAPRPRSLRAARTSGLLGDRSQRPSPRHPCLVRQPLASRGRISGDASASRRGNSTPVVRQGDPAHHTGFARSVLNCNALGT
jgi:hypothetical protein